MESAGLSLRTRYRELFKRRKEFTMANVLDRLAAVYGSRTAIILEEPLDYSFFQGTELSYTTLQEFVNRLGNALIKLDIKRGDRVAIYTRNLVELPLASYAAMKIGAVAIPLNNLLKAGEVNFILEDAQVKLLLTDQATFFQDYRSTDDLAGNPLVGFLDDPAHTPEGAFCLKTLMAEASPELGPVEMQPEDLVGIFYTSGTTGFPKGAKMTSKNLVKNNVRMPALILGLLPKEIERKALMVQPLSHIMGYALFLFNLTLGQPLVLLERFHPVRVLEAIQRHQVTTFIGVPAMYSMMLAAGAEKYNLKSVVLWVSGSDEMPPDLRKKFIELGQATFFGRSYPALFLEGYGQAETSPISTMYLHSTRFALGPGCIGWKLPGVQLKVVDSKDREIERGQVGELLVKGDHVMPGYWKNRGEAGEKVFTDDGWFHTGDMVRQGKYREYYLVDRKKDVIKHGGYSVFCKEVEEKIAGHPLVEEAALVGVPDEKKGQVPVAFICLRPGARITAEELGEWCRHHLAEYKVPRQIILLEEMPRGIALKTDKKALRARYLRQQASVGQ